MMQEPEPPQLADESRWYTEHAALLISTIKWALLGALAGVCVGLGTRAFLWALAWATAQAHRLDVGGFHAYYLLPLALPVCVWLIRTFAPTAQGARHGGGHRRRASGVRAGRPGRSRRSSCWRPS